MIFKIICQTCKREFENLRKNAKFCSHECYSKSLVGKPYVKKGVTKKCGICRKEFYVYPSTQSKKFCSPQCYFKSKKGIAPGNKGVKYSDEKKKNILRYSKIFKKGNIPHNKGILHHKGKKILNNYSLDFNTNLRLYLKIS